MIISIGGKDSLIMTNMKHIHSITKKFALLLNVIDITINAHVCEVT